MNRSERRRLPKAKKKPKTYTLTEKQIAQIKADATMEAFQMLLSIPVMVLHDKFGFGRQRLDRFMERVMFWARDAQNNEVSIADLMQTAEEVTGYKFEG